MADWLEAAKEGLEAEMNRWDFLEPIAPVPAPISDEHGETDVCRLDARLQELSAMRGRWDVLLGHLAMLMKNVGLWRDCGFASFAHYSDERLGMSARTVEQRAALARRCYSVPDVREAMKDGRLPYEKARRPGCRGRTGRCPRSGGCCGGNGFLPRRRRPRRRS